MEASPQSKSYECSNIKSIVAEAETNALLIKWDEISHVRSYSVWYKRHDQKEYKGAAIEGNQVRLEGLQSDFYYHVYVSAECEKACTLEIDGALAQHPTFFVTPDVEHSLKAAFDNGETSTFVQGTAGAIKNVTLAAPAPPPPPPVPRWAFFSSLGATVALGAVAAWSGIDANKGVSAYESAARSASSPGINTGGSPTPQEQAAALLDEGQQKERRTNILIGVTAGMAATTAVLGVFTNWKGESRDASSKRIEPSIGVSTKGGALTIKGRF